MLTATSIEIDAEPSHHRFYDVVATTEGVRLSPTCERGHEMVMEVLQRFGLAMAMYPHRAHPITPAPTPTPTPPSNLPATRPPPVSVDAGEPSSGIASVAASTAPTLSRIAALHLGNMKRGKNEKQSAIRERRYVLELLQGVIGDKLMTDISVDDAAKFADVLAVWPTYRHNYPDFNHMAALDIATKAKQEKYRPINQSTQAKHIKAVKAFFHACVENGSIPEDPFRFIEMSRYRDAIPRKKEIFTTQDLEALFNPDRMRTYTEPHKYWVPLIALHTGMRVNEIAQLYLEDIVCEDVVDETGQAQRLLCFDITPFRKGQHIKTPHSKRRIPVHSKLLELGFATYLEDVRRSGSAHLFPGLTWSGDGPGRVITRWFNGPHLRNICGITSRAKTLHCFRHTITTLADRSWVPPSIMRTINGHADGHDVENQSYVARGTLMECKRALEKLPFPQLDLEPYVSERFAGYLAHAAEEEKHRERVDAEGKQAPRRKGRPPRLPITNRLAKSSKTTTLYPSEEPATSAMSPSVSSTSDSSTNTPSRY